MPQFELTKQEQKDAEYMVEFVKRRYDEMSVKSRFVFAMQIVNHMKPEIDELKRKAEDAYHESRGV